MKLTNLFFYNKNFEKTAGDLYIKDGLFAAKHECEREIDMKRLTALPGFVDIHSHGGSGCDFCDGTEESLDTLSIHYARHGVTSVCPTTMTFPKERLTKIFTAIADYKGKEKGATFLPVNMEGPFISKEKCGAQCPDYIVKPDFELFKLLNEIYPIALVDVAPENDGAFDFAKKAKDICTVSAAHTNASYEVAAEALKQGFTHATHFLNAMTPFTSRAPGVAGAFMENNFATAEIICDGYHLAPATLRLLFKVFGENRLCVISDSMASADCPDGDYSLGGQRVIVKDGKANLPDGTIAGSTANLFDEFKNLISFGIDLEKALKACTINPARAVKCDNVCGTIEQGKNADLIFVDNDLNISAVMIKGKFLSEDLLK